jgi:hypothetical protein
VRKKKKMEASLSALFEFQIEKVQQVMRAEMEKQRVESENRRAESEKQRVRRSHQRWRKRLSTYDLL